LDYLSANLQWQKKEKRRRDKNFLLLNPPHLLSRISESQAKVRFKSGGGFLFVLFFLQLL